ncbi:hypothetical protein [Halorubrum spindle-shaped virus-BLv25]|nr:hypothetical protein [Halorubrum spindle-shaped virus-BLv25]
MNFGKFDVMILVTMSLAIISMSFVFPALGLTDTDNADESDIPELDIQSDRFDIVGDLPERPRSTDSGVLVYRSDGFDNRDIDLYVDGGNLIVGTSIFADDSGNTTPINVFLNEYDSDSGLEIDSDNTTLNETGDMAELTVENETEYTVRYELLELRNEGTGDFEAQVRFEVIESPGSDGFLGIIFGAADTLASTIAWIGTVFYWFSVSLFEVAGNALGAIFDVTSYFFSLIAWLTTTYTGIIASAGGFASVFVTIPGILLGAILGKIVIIGIGLLPTT